jgi:FlaA1/EpsC-like NDP-sugar epimerase
MQGGKKQEELREIIQGEISWRSFMVKKLLNLKYEMFEEWTLGRFLMNYRRVSIFIFQFFLTFLAYIASFLIRFEFKIPADEFDTFLKTLPILLIARMVAYFYYKIDSGWWRFVSMQDLMNIFKSVFWGSTIFVVTMAFINRLQGYPRSVILIEALLNLMATGGIRFFIRFFRESNGRKESKIVKDAIIVGAGKAGVLILNEIRTNTNLGTRVVGFVDDNSYIRGMNIQGVPVLGSTENIPEIVEKKAVDEVIIAIPSAGYKDIARITEIARNTPVKIKVLPNLGKLIQEDSFTGQLRDISYDELLGRRVIAFRRESDYKFLEREIKDKAVLVTGAGGSIGSELCRQVSQFNPRILIMYDRYENSLYELELGLRKQFPNQSILPVIGDIRDGEKFGKILQENGVSLIYHAAAYKHVPLMEREPVEAVRNNVLGTFKISKLAVANKVNKFVMISSDKAVKPSSMMGTTKRVAELIVQGLSGEDTKFISVRFGNVIGSNGSVIPIFKKQIAEGGPITVTHPEVARYFMSISEAVQLVMTAGAMGQGGEIFLLDMGEPIKIVDLAKKMINFSGLTPEKDIDIVFTGLRPGEKLQEELYWQGEGIVPTENKKITMLKPNGRNFKLLLDRIGRLEECERCKDVKGIFALLKEIVPEARIGL